MAKDEELMDSIRKLSRKQRYIIHEFIWVLKKANAKYGKEE